MIELAIKRKTRVLVALDPAAPMPSALEALTALAADLSPELIGLFVEDANLRRLCSLSCVREVSMDTGIERGLELGLMLNQLRVQRLRMERLLARAARQLRVPHRVEVIRGELVEELLRAAALTDLFLVGRASGMAGARSWMGSRLHELVGTVPGTVAIVHEPWRIGHRILVACDGDAAGRAALTLAARLAGSERVELVVALGDGGLSSAAKKAGLMATLARQAPLVDTRWVELGQLIPERLATLARGEQARAVVLGAGDPGAAAQMVEALLQKLCCSIVTVRPPPGAGSSGSAEGS